MSAEVQIYPDLNVVLSTEARTSAPEPGLTRKLLAYNDKLSLISHHMKKGWVGTLHSHPHEQAVYVVNGHLEVSCAGKKFEVGAGDSFVVRGGVEHAARAIQDSLVVDVFTPLREDYL